MNNLYFEIRTYAYTKNALEYKYFRIPRCSVSGFNINNINITIDQNAPQSGIDGDLYGRVSALKFRLVKY